MRRRARSLFVSPTRTARGPASPYVGCQISPIVSVTANPFGGGLELAEPRGLDAFGLAVAAAVVEMMAGRRSRPSPSWTAAVPAAPQRLFLVQAAESLPRLRRLCEQEGPEPFRRRGLLAPPDFLTAA